MGRLRIIEDQRELRHVGLGEHTEIQKLLLDFIKEVGIGVLREQRGLVVLLECLPDCVGLVGKI